MVLPYFFVYAPRDFLDWAWYLWEGCLAMRHVSATGRKHTCWSHHPRDFLVRFEDLDHVLGREDQTSVIMWAHNLGFTRIVYRNLVDCQVVKPNFVHWETSKSSHVIDLSKYSETWSAPAVYHEERPPNSLHIKPTSHHGITRVNGGKPHYPWHANLNPCT